MEQAAMLGGMDGAWLWAAGLIGFAVGIGAGYLLTVMLSRSMVRVRQLEEELDKIREKHETYQTEVHTHFSRSSDLFMGVTEKYRELYDHLAHGAKDLCGNMVATALHDLPDQGLLDEKKV